MLMFVTFCVIAGVTLLSFYFFDCLVRSEHKEFHQAWLEDGSPIGFFWVPSDSKRLLGILPSLGSSNARTTAYFKWAIVRPIWTIKLEGASGYYLRFRISVFLVLFGSLIWGGMLVLRAVA